MKTTRSVSYVTVALLATATFGLSACSPGASSETVTDTSHTTSADSTTELPPSASSSPTTSSSAPTPTSSSTPSAPPPETTGLIESDPAADEDISAEEAANRAAAEQAWLSYQRVAGELWKEPPGTWKAALEKYAGQPILTQALESAEQGAKDGKGNWGQPVHHVYTIGPINGGATADLGDCIDASSTGSMDVKTGKKLTRGVEHQNTLVTLVRTGDDWKVSTVTYTPNLACPGAPTANEEKTSILAATPTITTEEAR